MTISLSKPVWGSQGFPGLWNFNSRLAKSLLLFSSLLIAFAAPAQQDFAAPGASISEQELPAQGLETYRNIRKGGPFPFEKNYQRIGDRFCAIKISLQRENGFEPKNPRYADSGLG